MKALFLTETRKLQVHDVSMRERLASGNVRIRVKKVGICGSDLHYFKHGHIGAQTVSFPFILGHECSGIVEETGEGVTHVKPGDHAFIDPSISCGRCIYCHAGRRNLCLSNLFLGTPPQPGAYRQFIDMPAENVFRVDRRLDLNEVAMIEPFSIGLYAVSTLGQVTAGDVVSVQGCGGIGLVTIQAAKLAGAARIIAFDRVQERLEAAKKIGADEAVNVDSVPPLTAVERFTKGSGVDVAFECSGSLDAIEKIVRLPRSGGRVVFIGSPEEDLMSFPPDISRRKGLVMYFCRRTNDMVARAITLLEGNRANLGLLTTHTFTPEEATTAFEKAIKYSEGIIRGVISF